MGKVKVLVVEDDPMVSFLHKAILIKKDICSSPQGCFNGVEAIDYLRNDSKREQDAFYLILLDLNMPVMNGWEFLEALENLEVSRRTEVVIVTSSPDREDREKAGKIDLVSDYLEKPLIDFNPVIEIKRKLEERIN